MSYCAAALCPILRRHWVLRLYAVVRPRFLPFILFKCFFYYLPTDWNPRISQVKEASSFWIPVYRYVRTFVLSFLLVYILSTVKERVFWRLKSEIFIFRSSRQVLEEKLERIPSIYCTVIRRLSHPWLLIRNLMLLCPRLRCSSIDLHIDYLN